jgi:hypothetical protein
MGVFDGLMNKLNPSNGLFGPDSMQDAQYRNVFGESYSPEAYAKERRRALLRGAGMSLLSQEPTRFKQGPLTPFAQAFGKGAEAMDQGGQDYLKMAETSSEAAKTAREQAKHKAFMDAALAQAPPEIQAMAKAYPDLYAKAYFENEQAKQKAAMEAQNPTAPEYYGTGYVYENIKDPTQTQVVQLRKDGKNVLPDSKEWRLSQRVTYGDTGTELVPLGNRTGTQVGTPIAKSPEEEANLKKKGALKAEREAEKPLVTARLTEAITALDTADANLVDILDDPGLKGNYGLRGMFPNAPWGEAATTWQKIKTAGYQQIIGQMAALKQLSATGSTGFGQMVTYEEEILKNAIASLDSAQGEEAVRIQMNKLREAMAKSKANLLKAYMETYSGQDASTAEDDALINKY